MLSSHSPRPSYGSGNCPHDLAHIGGIAFDHLGTNLGAQLVVNAGSFAATFVVAYGVAWVKSAPWALPAPVGAIGESDSKAPTERPTVGTKCGPARAAGSHRLSASLCKIVSAIAEPRVYDVRGSAMRQLRVHAAKSNPRGYDIQARRQRSEQFARDLDIVVRGYDHQPQPLAFEVRFFVTFFPNSTTRREVLHPSLDLKFSEIAP